MAGNIIMKKRSPSKRRGFTHETKVNTKRGYQRSKCIQDNSNTKKIFSTNILGKTYCSRHKSETPLGSGVSDRPKRPDKNRWECRISYLIHAFISTVKCEVRYV